MARRSRSSNVLGFLRRTVKRSANVVRRIGRNTTATVRRGTNAVGLTRRRTVHRRR